MNTRLQQILRQLRLSGLAESLDVRLQEAASHGLSHTEFLELILEDELAVRRSRAVDRRLKHANFREMKTLDNFDFSFNPSLPKRRIFDLASGGFLREARDVLLLGPPGTGKSHVCQSVGRAVIKAGFTVLYRSIFDVGTCQ
jgi:DNA replication protein DnaC